MIVHSDQDSQYRSADYLAFMKENNLAPSMSRAGNCHDNSVWLVVAQTKDNKFFVSLGQLHATATPYKTSDAMRVELIPNRGEPIRFNIKDGKVQSLIFDDATFKRIK